MTTICNDAPAFLAAAKHSLSLLSSQDLNDFVVEMRALEDMPVEAEELIQFALKILGQRLARQIEIEYLAEELKAFAA